MKKNSSFKSFIIALFAIAVFSNCTFIGLAIGDAAASNKVAEYCYLPDDADVFKSMPKDTWLKVYTLDGAEVEGKFVGSEIDIYGADSTETTIIINVMGQKKHTYIPLTKIGHIGIKDETTNATAVGGGIGIAIDLSIIGVLLYQLGQAFQTEP